MESEDWTSAIGTFTTEGFIPHLVRDGITHPVRLLVDTSSAKAAKQPQRPERIGETLVYATPGGGRTLA